MDVAAEVRALVADLLPVLAPHAMLDADSGLLVLPVGTAHADISLDGITQVCAGLPPAAWPSRIEAWLADMAAEVTAALSDRDRLRVQLTPRLPDRDRDRLMCTAYGELLDVVVMLDGHRLTRAAADRLAVPDPGSSALANTLHHELPTFTIADRTLPDDGPLRIVGKPGSPYATSALLDLGRFLPGPCPYGVLLALPRYSQVLLHPVHPDTLPGAAGAMAELAGGAYFDTDDPCDDRLYWWADESLYVIGFHRITGRAQLPWALRKLLP